MSIFLNCIPSLPLAPEHVIEPALTMICLLKKYVRQLSQRFTTRPSSRIQIYLSSHYKEYSLLITMRGRTIERAQYAGKWEWSEEGRRGNHLMRELVIIMYAMCITDLCCTGQVKSHCFTTGVSLIYVIPALSHLSLSIYPSG